VPVAAAGGIHFGEILFTDDGTDDNAEVCSVKRCLFLSRCDVQDFCVARGQLFHDEFFGAAEQNWPQSFAKLIKVLIAEHCTFLILNSVAVEEAKGGSQLPSIDELHHGKQFIQPVFHGSSGENKAERRWLMVNVLVSLRIAAWSMILIGYIW
jgi:hypothetical protein